MVTDKRAASISFCLLMMTLRFIYLYFHGCFNLQYNAVKGADFIIL